jgi:hypothetical protein
MVAVVKHLVVVLVVMVLVRELRLSECLILVLGGILVAAVSSLTVDLSLVTERVDLLLVQINISVYRR